MAHIATGYGEVFPEDFVEEEDEGGHCDYSEGIGDTRESFYVDLDDEDAVSVETFHSCELGSEHLTGGAPVGEEIKNDYTGVVFDDIFYFFNGSDVSNHL